MKVKKAVILAGGMGTRFLPITKSMPKEMLPLLDKPVIHYVVQETIKSGIDDILIVTGRGKRAVEDYFDDSPELEMHLKKHNKAESIEMIKKVSSLANIHYIRQKEPMGLADAVLKAEKHVSNQPFALLLGDDIIHGDKPCTKQLIDIYNKYQCSILAVQQVPMEIINRYGVIKGKKIEEELYMVEDIIEKPKKEDAPSNVASIGRYVFTPEIFDCIKKTKLGVNNELQITDAIRILMENQNVYAYGFRGHRYDTGDRIGYIKAFVDFSLKNKDLEDEILHYINQIKN